MTVVRLRDATNPFFEVMVMLKRIAFATLFLGSAQAFGWSAISLGGGNWAILCANGTAWSYSGSSAGLDVVGPALCPAGLAAPNVPAGAKTGVSTAVDYNLLRNRKEISDRGIAAARTYPPHGYPCLGCVPCPGNPKDFCDVDNKARVFLAPWTPTGRIVDLTREPLATVPADLHGDD